MTIIYCSRPEACPDDQWEVVRENPVLGTRILRHRCPGHQADALGEPRSLGLTCQACAPEPFVVPYTAKSREALLQHYEGEHMESLKKETL